LRRVPNPEAIACYVQRSERLLNESREEVRLLRLLAGQLAGFSGAVLALAGANSEAIVASLEGPSRVFTGGMLLSGVLMLIMSLIVALRGVLLPPRSSGVSATEVANFASARFTDEPDLWRAQVRTIRGLLGLIEATTQQSAAAERSAGVAGLFFLVGLSLVGVALAIVIAVKAF
jgi:hypothetical protein